jgi:hypothetical protein
VSKAAPCYGVGGQMQRQNGRFMIQHLAQTEAYVNNKSVISILDQIKTSSEISFRVDW